MASIRLPSYTPKALALLKYLFSRRHSEQTWLSPSLETKGRPHLEQKGEAIGVRSFRQDSQKYSAVRSKSGYEVYELAEACLAS
jgi:hypothetical protein